MVSLLRENVKLTFSLIYILLHLECVTDFIDLIIYQLFDKITFQEEGFFFIGVSKTIQCVGISYGKLFSKSIGS